MAQPVKESEGRERRRLVRAASLISALTLLSRILGLVREQVFAALMGAGLYADAFQAAFRIPNLLRDLFAEGALSAAFVPTYARTLAQGGEGDAHRLANRLLSVLLALLGVLVFAGVLGAPAIVSLLAPGFDRVPGKTELTVLLTRIMLPFLPLVSCAAVAMGMLNARERWGPPALAPALFNVMAVLWAGVLVALGWEGEKVAMGWALGTLLGGLAQLLVQVPALLEVGWRPRLLWAPRDPAIREIALLMTPATVGLAAVQVNIFVSTLFASQEPGAVSWLTYAFRILYLPIGLFGVALGTIATTGLARLAAAGDLGGLRTALHRSLRLLCFLTIPATAGLLALATPIVRLLFERGRFSAHDTEQTAAAVACYGVGLVAYTGVKVLAPAFYALRRPRVPLVGSVLAVLTNVAVILALHGSLGFRSVALGTGLGSIVQCCLLLAVFERGHRGQGGLPVAGGLVRMAVAAAVMVPCSRLVLAACEHQVGTTGLGAQLVTGLFPILAGALAYLAVARLLGLPEVDALRRRSRA